MQIVMGNFKPQIIVLQGILDTGFYLLILLFFLHIYIFYMIDEYFIYHHHKHTHF